jgi:hypothetical protein
MRFSVPCHQPPFGIFSWQLGVNSNKPNFQAWFCQKIRDQKKNYAGVLSSTMPRHPTPEPLGNGAMWHQGTDSHYFASKTSLNPIFIPRCLSISFSLPRSPSVPLGPPRSPSVPLGPPRSPSVPLGPPRSPSVSLAVQIENCWRFSGHGSKYGSKMKPKVVLSVLIVLSLNLVGLPIIVLSVFLVNFSKSRYFGAKMHQKSCIWCQNWTKNR